MILRTLVIVALGFTFGLGGCASKNVNTPEPEPATKIQTQFEKGLKQMDEERYAEAAKIFEKILVQSPASEFDFIVMYNLGGAREGLKECGEAAQQYKRVARGSAGKFPRIEAMALLRLSYAFECLGQDDKVVVSLLDVRRRAKILPEDTMKAELPARLAAAYARRGNREEAEKYFKEALNGIKFMHVKYKDSRKVSDTLAETLYFMGRSNVSEAEFLRNPVAQVRGLELTQLYLLQASELGSAKWSGRAVDEILQHYDLVWKYMDKLPEPEESDSAIRERRLSQLKADILKETLRSVRALRAQRLPTRQEEGIVKKLFEKLADHETRLTTALAETGPLTNLTPQAEKREGLKRSGRVHADRPSQLEKSKSP